MFSFLHFPPLEPTFAHEYDGGEGVKEWRMFRLKPWAQNTEIAWTLFIFV